MSDENVLYGKVSDSQQLGGLIRQKRKGLGGFPTVYFLSLISSP